MCAATMLGGNANIHPSNYPTISLAVLTKADCSSTNDTGCDNFIIFQPAWCGAYCFSPKSYIVSTLFSPCEEQTVLLYLFPCWCQKYCVDSRTYLH